MFKVFLLFLALALCYLFYPFHDLYVREDPFAAAYVPAGKGFWTRDACAEAAEAQHAGDFRCHKRTGFGSLRGTYTQYGLSGREATSE
jgi:hypothetical protein